MSEEKKRKLIESVPQNIKEDIQFAYRQVNDFAVAQRSSIQEFEKQTIPGVRLGQKLIPMDVAGCYIPGGRFAHACSAIMSIATAKAAGVPAVIACSPPRGGSIAPAVIYAMEVAGADIIMEIGGIQAIATMAYGLFRENLPIFLLALETHLWLKQKQYLLVLEHVLLMFLPVRQNLPSLQIIQLMP